MAPFEIFLSQKFYPNVHKNASNCTIKKTDIIMTWVMLRFAIFWYNIFKLSRKLLCLYNL